MTNPTPRVRFQESGTRISAHREMVQTPEFQIAMDFAIMEYQRSLSAQPTDNFNMAAANHFKLVGAQEFAMTLKLLAEKPVRGPVIVEPQLNHEA